MTVNGSSIGHKNMYLISGPGPLKTMMSFGLARSICAVLRWWPDKSVDGTSPGRVLRAETGSSAGEQLLWPVSGIWKTIP